jgi:SPP1 gp7 family putative phage head morphogenesis protein
MKDLYIEKFKLQHRLQGIANSLEADLIEHLEAAKEQVSGKIVTLAAKAEESGSALRRMKWLQAQQAEIEKVLSKTYKRIGKDVEEKFLEVGVESGKVYNLMLKGTQLATLKLGIPNLTERRVRAWYNAFNVDGYFFNDYVKTMEANASKRMIKEVKLSLVSGDRLRETVKRVRKTLDASKNGADALAKTAVFTAQAEGERAFADHNKDRLKYGIYHTEADGKVCPQCAPMDLQVYELENVPRVPIHMRCRCWIEYSPDKTPIAQQPFRVEDPVTKELTVYKFPAEMTHNEIMQQMVTKEPAFVKEAYGPKRFELLKSGDLTVDKLYYQGKLRTIKDLKELY